MDLMKTLPSSVSPEFIRQRRAVYHGLCTVLTEPEAAAALVVWTEHFSDPDSAFSGLNSFVRDVSSSFNKVESQRELLHAISRALVTRQEDLRPAPSADGHPVSPILAQEPVPSSAPESALSSTASNENINETPEFQSFCVLLLALLNQAQHQQAPFSEHFHIYIKEVVNDLPWSEAQQEQLIKLVDEGRTQQMRTYRDGQLKALFGHIKVWMEEKLERKTSAAMIERAMTDAGKTEAGRQYSPKAFF
jgi:hypothetical protein